MDGRLEQKVVPAHYHISIDPSFTKEEDCSFQGHERIAMQLGAPTQSITLHAKKLGIDGVQYVYNEGLHSIPLEKVEYNPDDETATLHFYSKLPSGEGELSLDFSGKLGKQEGLHRSKYTTTDGSPRYMLTTQMEPVHAREMFPCFDEPALKAKYDLSVIVGENLTAISNTRVTGERELGGGRKKVTFATTPVMSSYLLYLGAGEFESLEEKVGDVTLRVLTVPGQREKGRFALEVTQRVLAYFKDYFGIQYPLDKLDLIGIPDFSAGAMENWGAITFRQDMLLYDEKTASYEDRQRVAMVVAHELAHQWFGNLVTMNWWNDLWLNESFADFLAVKAQENCYPDMKADADFVGKRVNTAFELDALASSHPINIPVRTSAEIKQTFTPISYSKGGMVLRMLEKHIGAEAFREGLQRYLRMHEYGNAEGQDLWHEFGEVTGQPIAKMMEPWTNQMGYPVLDVARDGTQLTLAQRRFTYGRIADDKTWIVPVKVETDTGERRKILLGGRVGVVSVSERTQWIKVNAGQDGLFRVKYSDELQIELGKALVSGKLGNYDRRGLHNDLAALSIAGEVSLRQYLGFVDSYRDEEDYLVLNDVFRALRSFSVIASEESFLPEIHKKARSIYDSVLKRLGMTPALGEQETNTLLRSEAWYDLGRLEDENIIAQSQKLFLIPSKINPSMKSAVYKVAAMWGDAQVYDTLVQRQRDTTDPQEHRKILAALAEFRDRSVLERVLEFTLSDRVRDQDKVHTLEAMNRNPVGRKRVWQWMEERWGTIKLLYSGTLANHVKKIAMACTLADTADAARLAKFFARDPIPEAQQEFNRTLERITINAQFVERARRDLV